MKKPISILLSFAILLTSCTTTKMVTQENKTELYEEIKNVSKKKGM